MKRTFNYVKPTGSARCVLPDGEEISVPVVPGILKTPSHEALPELLSNPDVLRKYTREALRKAPWQALQHFPPKWLRRCLDEAELTEGRRRAVEFMLDSWFGMAENQPDACCEKDRKPDSRSPASSGECPISAGLPPDGIEKS